MKVTKNLLEWLHREFENRKMTYAELGRRGGTSYQNFQRLLQGISAEIQQDMVDATCAAFGVSQLQLLQIAEGKHPDNHDPELRHLFHWIKQSASPETRAAIFSVARAGGYISEFE